jgi:hypothetical protein
MQSGRAASHSACKPQAYTRLEGGDSVNGRYFKQRSTPPTDSTVADFQIHQQEIQRKIKYIHVAIVGADDWRQNGNKSHRIFPQTSLNCMRYNTRSELVTWWCEGLYRLNLLRTFPLLWNTTFHCCDCNSLMVDPTLGPLNSVLTHSSLLTSVMLLSRQRLTS